MVVPGHKLRLGRHESRDESTHQIQSPPVAGVSERVSSNEREESDWSTVEGRTRGRASTLSTARISWQTSPTELPSNQLSKRERIPIAPHTRVREQNYRICEQRRAQFLFTHRTGLNPRWFHYISHIFLKSSCENPFTPNLEREQSTRNHNTKR